MDDAKKVLQGGLEILPQKNREACRLYYKSGILITTTELPDFGQGPDGRAIRERLAVFEMKPLKKVRRFVTAWLRKNFMTMFHYCANLLKEDPLFSDDEDSEGDNADNDEGAKYNEYDNTKSDAFLDIDQISSFQLSQEPFDIILEETQEKVRLDVLPEKILDESYLNRDEARPHTWKRNN